MINEVRNAVLSILNKNNYGYISPSDFNLYAANAQMEIYEEYFSSYNKAINYENARSSGTDYADIEGPLSETLETFLVSNFLSNVTEDLFNTTGNSFYTPSLTTTGDTAYYILKLLCYPTIITTGTNTAVTANALIDSAATFLTDGISQGDIVVNETNNKVAYVLTVVSNTQIKIDKDIFLAVSRNYKIVKAYSKEADKVSAGKITMLNSSTITKPSAIFPSYTLEGNEIRVYPNTFNSFGQLQAVYFRHPLTPKWTYTSLTSGEPVFNQSQPDYQDFELPLEDGYKLVTKILEYCGMSIREGEITQFGMTQQAHEQPSFSIQQ
jgi:hypothetical protein